MNFLVTGGLLGLLLATGGLGGASVSPIIDQADPRQGTVVSTDNDPAAVDPRQGTIVL